MKTNKLETQEENCQMKKLQVYKYTFIPYFHESENLQIVAYYFHADDRYVYEFVIDKYMLLFTYNGHE